MGRSDASADSLYRLPDAARWRRKPSTDLERRAASGDREAQTALGTLYETGDGVPLDPAQGRGALSRGRQRRARRRADQPRDDVSRRRRRRAAIPRPPWRWLRRAAATGDAFAQLNLGMLLETGDPPVARDPTQAARWYREAADAGLDGGAVPPGAAVRERPRRARAISIRRRRGTARRPTGPIPPRSCGSASCSAPATARAPTSSTRTCGSTCRRRDGRTRRCASRRRRGGTRWRRA